MVLFQLGAKGLRPVVAAFANCRKDGGSDCLGNRDRKVRSRIMDLPILLTHLGVVVSIDLPSEAEVRHSLIALRGCSLMKFV